MSPSLLPFPSFLLFLCPFFSSFPSTCYHMPTHLLSHLLTSPSIHPNTVPLLTTPTHPITHLLFHFSSICTFLSSTFPHVPSSTVCMSTHHPSACPCEYPPRSQFHLFTFHCLLFYPSTHPPFTIHLPTYLPTYLPVLPSPIFSPLSSSPLSFPTLPFYLLLICSSTPHIYPPQFTVYSSTHYPSTPPPSIKVHPSISPPVHTLCSPYTYPPIHSSILPPFHPPFLPPFCLFTHPSIHINSFLSYVNL